MNKKVLPIIAGIAITSILTTGCSNINKANNKERIIKVSNISEDKDEDDLNTKTIISGDIEEIIAHNNFQIISHTEKLDLDNLKYKIDLVFQNTDKNPLNNIKSKYSFNIGTYSIEGNFEQEVVQAGENVEKTLTISIKDIIDDHYSYTSSDNIDYEGIVSNWNDRDKEIFKYSYSYSDKKGSTIQIDSIFSNQWNAEDSLLTIKK